MAQDCGIRCERWPRPARLRLLAVGLSAALAAAVVAACGGGGEERSAARSAGPGSGERGGKIAFSRWEGRSAGLWTMNADGSRKLRLAGKRQVGAIVWSPDARRLAFTAVARGVGRERAFEHDELFVVNADGSGLRRLTWTRRAGSRNFSVAAAWFPDSRRILYEKNDDGPDGIYVINADGSRRRLLREGAHAAVLSPDARTIAFTAGEENYIMNADGRNARRLPLEPGTGAAPAWSPPGRITTLPGTPADKTGWSWQIGFTWSPDGRRLAVAVLEKFRGDYQIWVAEADGERKHKLTTTPGGNHSPAWSADGRRIAFTSYRDGNPEIYVMRSDGREQRRLTRHPAGDLKPVWSPQGSGT